MAHCSRTPRPPPARCRSTPRYPRSPRAISQTPPWPPWTPPSVASATPRPPNNAPRSAGQQFATLLGAHIIVFYANAPYARHVNPRLDRKNVTRLEQLGISLHHPCRLVAIHPHSVT